MKTKSKLSRDFKLQAVKMDKYRAVAAKQV